LHFCILIGLRETVGGDWSSYPKMYHDIQNNFFATDPGYATINKLSYFFGFGIYGVNFISAILFLFGLLTFYNTFNLKYSYAIFISFPFLILVVSMGVTHQSIAFGLLLISYLFFYKAKKLNLYCFFASNAISQKCNFWYSNFFIKF